MRLSVILSIIITALIGVSKTIDSKKASMFLISRDSSFLSINDLFSGSRTISCNSNSLILLPLALYDIENFSNCSPMCENGSCVESSFSTIYN
ncbi:hypothetical protein ES708_35283 [subsurface metagenome]